MKFNNILLAGRYAAVISISAFILLISCNSEPTVNTERVTSYEEDQKALLKQGEYLVTIMGCNDCHSPKVFTEHGPIPDPNRLLSGHPSNEPIADINKDALKGWVLFGMHNTAVAGPWGVSFAGNITSDETGIGLWNYEHFKTALTKGKFKGIESARNLLPPMPWPNYTQMKDSDIKAIFAYLKSTKPINNIVPNPIAPNEL